MDRFSCTIKEQGRTWEWTLEIRTDRSWVNMNGNARDFHHATRQIKMFMASAEPLDKLALNGPGETT